MEVCCRNATRGSVCLFAARAAYTAALCEAYLRSRQLSKAAATFDHLEVLLLPAALAPPPRLYGMLVRAAVKGAAAAARSLGGGGDAAALLQRVESDRRLRAMPDVAAVLVRAHAAAGEYERAEALAEEVLRAAGPAAARPLYSALAVACCSSAAWEGAGDMAADMAPPAGPLIRTLELLCRMRGFDIRPDAVMLNAVAARASRQLGRQDP